MTTPLSEIEKDAFSEILNIGVGHAAASLSQMVGQEIKLSIPVVEIMEREKAVSVLGGAQDSSIIGVREKFAGTFEGEAFLLFPEKNSLELVKLLLDDNLPLEVLTEMQQEALTEVGNIILTGCLSTLADILQEEISNEVPEFSQGSAGDVLNGCTKSLTNKKILFLKTMILFSIKKQDIKGHVTFLMDLEEMDTFRSRVSDTFGLEAEV